MKNFDSCQHRKNTRKLTKKRTKEQFVYVQYIKKYLYIYSIEKNEFPCTFHEIIIDTNFSFYWRETYCYVITDKYDAISRYRAPAWFIVELSFQIIYQILCCALYKIGRYDWIVITAMSQTCQYICSSPKMSLFYNSENYKNVQKCFFKMSVCK